MRKFFRKTLIYLLAIGMLCPTWLVTGMLSAPHAKAYDGTEVPRNVPSVIVNEFESFSSSDWIELLNTTFTPIDLSTWKITDTVNPQDNPIENASPVDLSGSIAPLGTKVVNLGTKLNKDGDSIKLYQGATVVDSLTYGTVKNMTATNGLAVTPAEGKSAAFVDGQWKTNLAPTQGLPNGPVTNQFSLAFTTIQSAVTAASVGDVINVAAGTYTENVNVNIPLTLQGAGSSNVTVTAANPATSVFNITANSVNISGFKVTGANVATTAGIYLGNNVTLCNISNNNLTGNGDGIWLGSGSNHNTLASNILSNNYQGFELYHSDYNIFTSNFADLNNVYGFKMESASSNTFTSNTANSNLKYGFYCSAGSTGCNNNTFTSNVANLNTEYGIRINSGTGNSLTNNTFDSNTLAGIRLKDNITSITLNNNNITNSPIGIDIAAGVGDVATWVLTHNNVSGNTVGVSNNGIGTLNATKNWWGNADLTEISKKIFGDVLFTPYYTDETRTVLSNGTGDEFVERLVNDSNSSNIVLGDITLVSPRAVTGQTVDITVTKNTGKPANSGSISLGWPNFYYDIDVSNPLFLAFPLNIEFSYSDEATATNYLNESKFVSLYYYDTVTSTWKDYRLDPVPSTVAIDTDANKITASLQHLTPIVPVIDTTAPAAPAINDIAVSGKTIKVYWNAVPGATEYYVYMVNKNKGIVSSTNYDRKSSLQTGSSYTVNSLSNGNYYVVVTAVDQYGNESAFPVIEQQIIVRISVPVEVTVAPKVIAEALAAVTVGPTPAVAAAPEAAPAATVAPTDDQNGKIKGDESQTEDSTDNKINWTPWIVLFILIILAGAATGGYFYWFSGEDEVNAATKEPKKASKAVEEKKITQKPRANQGKKSKRW